MSDDSGKKLASFFVYQQLSRRYATKPLPTFAWQAYALCHEYGLKIPKWVSGYLYEVSVGLLTLPQDKERVEPQIRRALKVKGNPYTQEVRFFELVQIATEAIELAEKPKHQVDGRPDWDTIISMVAEARDISEYKVISALEKGFGYLRQKKV